MQEAPPEGAAELPLHIGGAPQAAKGGAHQAVIDAEVAGAVGGQGVVGIAEVAQGGERLVQGQHLKRDGSIPVGEHRIGTGGEAVVGGRITMHLPAVGAGRRAHPAGVHLMEHRARELGHIGAAGAIGVAVGAGQEEAAGP